MIRQHQFPPVPEQSDLFPVRVTEKVPAADGKPARYGFQEVWVMSDGTWQDKHGGRTNDARGTPAYALSGECEVGDRVLCRLAPGAEWMAFELFR